MNQRLLWPGVKKLYGEMYREPLSYTALFGPPVKVTRWQTIRYYLWRKHWYRFSDWLRGKICGDCL